MRAQPSNAVYSERELQRDKQRKKYMEIYPLSGNTWRSTHFQELEKSSSGLLFFQMCMICRDETSLRFLACMLKTLKLFWNFKPGSYVCFRFFMFIFSLPLFFHLIPECLFSLFHQQGKPNIKKKAWNCHLSSGKAVSGPICLNCSLWGERKMEG